jgi:caa(3)-type oxidase subunit IV
MSEHAADHKAPKYMLIWLYLFILTVAEVGVAFLPISKGIIVVALLVMAFWKALMVAWYYMHMKWEPTRLRLVALAPLPAVAIMIVVIMMEYV